MFNVLGWVGILMLLVGGMYLNQNMVNDSNATKYYTQGVFGPERVYESDKKFDNLNIKLSNLIRGSEYNKTKGN